MLFGAARDSQRDTLPLTRSSAAGQPVCQSSWGRLAVNSPGTAGAGQSPGPAEAAAGFCAGPDLCAPPRPRTCRQAAGSVPHRRRSPQTSGAQWVCLPPSGFEHPASGVAAVGRSGFTRDLQRASCIPGWAPRLPPFPKASTRSCRRNAGSAAGVPLRTASPDRCPAAPAWCALPRHGYRGNHRCDDVVRCLSFYFRFGPQDKAVSPCRWSHSLDFVRPQVVLASQRG